MHLESNGTMSFYGATAQVTSWSATQITAIVSSTAGTGPVSVAVAGINTQGPGFTINTVSFTTDSLGNTSSYSSQMSAGQWLFTSGDGSGCSESGRPRGVVNKTYDGKRECPHQHGRTGPHHNVHLRFEQ